MLKKCLPFILGTQLLTCAPSATAENKLYVKGAVGLNSIHTTKFSNHDFEGKVKLGDSFPLVELGIGYKLNESIRAELALDYYFLFRTNETSNNTDHDIFNVNSKTKANALMVNIYKDIAIVGRFVPFVGVGVGVSTLKESASGYVVSQEDNIHYSLDSPKEKIVKRFAYKLTLGTDIKLSEDITCEVSYNYFNLGNNKAKIIGGIQNIGNRSYAIHNITLGVRVTI